jgi:hypothetical protein
VRRGTSPAGASSAARHALTGPIVASALTDRDGDDAAQVGSLLDRIADPVELGLGDGAYDRTNVSTQATEIAIAVTILNRMLDLGCPNSIRGA